MTSKWRTIRPLSIIAALLGLLAAPALLIAQSRGAQVDALFAPWATGRTPGADVVVIQDGKIVYEKGYGLANLERGEKIGPRTQFLLGSVSKQFTAMAIMMLAERGRLSYDDPLRKFFPQFPAYADSITVRQLLHHQAGFPEYEGMFVELGQVDSNWPRSVKTAPSAYEPRSKDALELLAQHAKLHFRPGERYQYSNSGYMILGQIVEKVSGQSLGAFLKENVFRPLGMTETVLYDDTHPPTPHRASSYTKDSTGFREIDYTPFNYIYGEDGVVSTLGDLFKWDQALYGERLVKRATLDLAFTPGRTNDGAATTYGFGWVVGTLLGQRTISHGGSWLGFRNAIRRYPDAGVTVVVLSNFDEFDPDGLASQVAALYLGDRLQHRTARAVPAGRLDRLLGKYEFSPRFVATVARAQDALWIEGRLIGRQWLAFDSDSTAFFATNEAMGLTFHAGADGAVNGLTFHRLESDLRAKRLP